MSGLLNIQHERYDTIEYCYFLKLVVYSDKCGNHNNSYCQTVEVCRHLLTEETAL